MVGFKLIVIYKYVISLNHQINKEANFPERILASSFCNKLAKEEGRKVYKLTNNRYVTTSVGNVGSLENK